MSVNFYTIQNRNSQEIVTASKHYVMAINGGMLNTLKYTKVNP